MKDRSLFISVIVFLVLVLIPTLMLYTPLKIIISPLITASFIVYVLNPFILFMKRRGLSGSFATILAGVSVILIASFMFIIIFPKAKEALENIYVFITDFLSGNGLEIPGEFVSKSVNAVYTTASNILRSSLSVIAGTVTAFYILKDTENIKHYLAQIIPEKLKSSFKLLADDVKSVTDSFFKGQIVVGMILCLLVSIFLYALKIPNALGLGIITGILDIVPYAGAFVAMGIIICITIQSVPEMTIFVIIGLLLIQQVENHIITPKVSCDTLNIHPAIVVPVLYIGSFGGFWGILLSVPIAAVIKKLLERLIQSII